jgi:hypothetical protein
MKFKTINGYVINYSNDEGVELDIAEGTKLFSALGYPKYRVVDGAAVALADGEEKSSREFYNAIIASRVEQYKLRSDPLFVEYAFMQATNADGAEAKKAAWLAEVEKIKAELPKPTVTFMFGF